MMGMRYSWLFWPVFAANMIGAFYGFFFFYPSQLLSSPLYLWPFIPDCPLFALLFAISMILVRTGARHGLAHLFNFLVFAGSLKYGFWTVFVLVSYPEFYASTALGAFLSTALTLAHIGLFFEAFLLASYVRPRLWHVAAVLLFLLLSDYADYVWLTHPPIPSYALRLLFPLTIAMTLFFTLAGYWVMRNARRPLLPILAPSSSR